MTIGQAMTVAFASAMLAIVLGLGADWLDRKHLQRLREVRADLQRVSRDKHDYANRTADR